MTMLDGHRPKNVKLRQAGSGLRRLWDVELVIRYGHMYLRRGWEQFYLAYDMRHIVALNTFMVGMASPSYLKRRKYPCRRS